MIKKTLPQDIDISGLDYFLLKTKYFIRAIVGNRVKWFGLETASMIFEYVPLFINTKQTREKLTRVKQ